MKLNSRGTKDVIGFLPTENRAPEIERRDLIGLNSVMNKISFYYYVSIIYLFYITIYFTNLKIQFKLSSQMGIFEHHFLNRLPFYYEWKNACMIFNSSLNVRSQ